MKKLMLILSLVLFVSGCTFIEDESVNDDEVVEDEADDDGYEAYLIYSDYKTLLDNLEGYSNINRGVIDNELEELNVRQSYDYSFYSGSSYDCFGLNWNSYNSYTYDWNYYVDVDIWINKNGTLKRSMCSYYEG